MPPEVTAVAHSEHSSHTGATPTVFCMSTEQTEAPQWGAPPPPAPPSNRWTAKRIVITVAIAVGIAAAGGVAIYAASGSTEQTGGGRGGAGGPVMIGGPLGGDTGTQHGEFQTGEVTELTDDAITAKSEDGYTKTYVIDDDTQMMGDIAKGDDVTVIATTEGSTTTAESVMEMGTMPQRRDGNGGPPNGGPPNDN